jgi:multidrug resistance efflux pump
MQRIILFVLIGTLWLSAGPGDAQTPKIQKAVEKKLENARAEQMAESLEEMLQQALKNNPDIRVAEAKVRETQAERERTRLYVAGEVQSLLADINAAKNAEKEGYDRWVRAKTLYDKGALAIEELKGAELTRDKLANEAASKKAKLPYLVGKVAFDDKGPIAGNLAADSLKSNPDILVADTKVQAAEAELNRTRLRVTADIGGLDAELQAARFQVKAAELSFERMKRLLAMSAVSKEDYEAVVSSLEKAKADLAVKEAKLPYLLGKQSANIGFYEPALALIHRGKSNANAAAAVDEAIKKVWFQKFLDSGTVVSDEEFLRRAMIDLQGRVPTPEEMKAFLKMPEKDRRAKWIEQQSKAATANVPRQCLWSGMGRTCIQCHQVTGAAFTPDGLWIDMGFPLLVAPDGKRYKALVAPHVLDLNAYLSIRQDTPLTEKLRKALDASVSVTLGDVAYGDAMDHVKTKLLPGINLVVRHKSKKTGVAMKLPEQVAVGAVLQYLEDELDVVFVLREYGIVVVQADEKLPPGAVRVLDFWKHGKTPEPAAAPKEKTSAPKEKATADGVRGVIEMVDPKDSRLVQISVGSDAGLEKDDLLDLFRLQPAAKFLGHIRVLMVMPTRLVARFVSADVEASSFPRVGDQVASKLAAK